MINFYPSQLEICLTENCNMDCDYCFVNKTSKKTLTAEKAKKVIDLFFCFPNKKNTVTFSTSETLQDEVLLFDVLNYISNKSKQNIKYLFSKSINQIVDLSREVHVNYRDDKKMIYFEIKNDLIDDFFKIINNKNIENRIREIVPNYKKTFAVSFY